MTGGEWLGSGWASDGRPLYAFSVHAPSGNAHHPRKSYVHEVKGILAAIRTCLASNDHWSRDREGAAASSRSRLYRKFKLSHTTESVILLVTATVDFDVIVCGIEI